MDVLYLLQTNNPATVGQGHAAALVGDDQNGWTYYSFAPNPFGPNFTVNRYKTLSDAAKDPEVSRYDQYLLYYTSRQQDLNAMLQAAKDYNDSYNPRSNNCGNEAAKTIRAAVPTFKNDSFSPKVIYFHNVNSANSSGGTNDLISNYYFPEDP